MGMNSTLTIELIGDFLAKLAEKSSSVYWLSSPDLKRIIYISPAYEEIWGRSREELYKNPETWITFLHPDDAKNYHLIHALAERVASLGSAARFEETYRVVRPDGEIRWVVDRGFPVFNDNGECCGVTGIAVDITKEKQAEEMLRIAKDRAEAANRAKSEFLGIVSHELRLPLTGILGMAHMLNLDCLLPAQHEQVEDIINSSEHLLSLVDDLLDVAKLEAGKMELHPAPLDLRKLLEETTIMLTFQIKSKGLELLVDYDENAPHRVVADARALRQIIINLVGNALKFTEQGYILIRVKCLQQSDTQAQLELSIEDTGIGIAEDKLKMIFDRFQQGDSSYERRYGGTGLGLTISKAYTELMGGTMSVHSQLGKGSIFSCTFSLPIQALASLASPWETYKSSVKILIVDDTLRGEVLAKHIASQNLQIVTGKEALETLIVATQRNQPFDIVIMDQQLSTLDAMELGRSINTRLSSRRPMLFLLIPDANPLTKEASKAAGFFGSIVKPAQPTELLTNLTAAWETWLEKNQKRASTAKSTTNENSLAFKKILLVEDDQIVQKVHRMMLEHAGYQVDLAKDGPRALELCAQNNYDLILMDIGLPGMSGLDVTSQIRRQEGEGQHTPIIALTGYTHEEDRKNCLAIGMDDVITKPIAVIELQKIVERWLTN